MSGVTPDRKPTTGFWITVALVAVLVGYPLSYGAWHYARGVFGPTNRVVRAVHWPFIPLAHLNKSGPACIADPYREFCLWCVRCGAEEGD